MNFWLLIIVFYFENILSQDFENSQLWFDYDFETLILKNVNFDWNMELDFYFGFETLT